MPAEYDITVIGGGVCGVLAAQRLGDEGLSYKVIERLDDFGYKLDGFPFKKCPGHTVLRTLRNFAADYDIQRHTSFSNEVLNITREADTYTVYCKHTSSGQLSSVKSRAVLVCTGILGKQFASEHRGLPAIEKHTGHHMFAGKEGMERNYLQGDGAAKGKDVVILGSGAFGLEAMEAAQRAGAKSITVVTRPRDRCWHKQPISLKGAIHMQSCVYASCCLMHSNKELQQWWLTTLYKECGIEAMIPAGNTLQSFTGQCNDAFFQYPKQGLVKYRVDEVAKFDGNCIELKVGGRLNADILVIALGHEVQDKPAFLQGLQLRFTHDLHNFAFLGKNPLLGAASDWVWFNVPHGPQKQIKCFISAFKAHRMGKGKALKNALLPTPFAGCKGESFNISYPSGMQQRKEAYRRTLAAGMPWHQQFLLSCKLTVEEWAIWLLCATMYCYESYALNGWLTNKIAS